MSKEFRLFHGTSSRHLPQILRQGILPRSVSGHPGNWKRGWQSKSGFVYLSTAYPVYYASEATLGDDDMVIIEVDIDRIDSDLYPDDEFIARLLHLDKPSQRIEDILVDVDPREYQEHWSDSLERSGTIACFRVPTAAIVRHRVVPAKFWSITGGDAVPSLENYLICGSEYKEVIDCFLDGGEEAVIQLARRRNAECRV